MTIAVDLVIIVGDAVHLVGPQVMRIGRPAALVHKSAACGMGRSLE